MDDRGLEHRFGVYGGLVCQHPRATLIYENPETKAERELRPLPYYQSNLTLAFLPLIYVLAPLLGMLIRIWFSTHR